MSRVYQINLSNESVSDKPISFDELEPSNWAFKKRFKKKFMSNGKCECNVYKIGVSMFVSVLLILGIIALIVLGALGKLSGPKPLLAASVALPANVSIELAAGQACGVSRPAKLDRSKLNQKRIIGGITSARNSLPWVVSLRLNQFGQISGHFCAGSIITDQHILTAAHCAVNRSPADIIVLAGIYDLDVFSQQNVFYVQSVTINQEYVNGVVNDIAILKLAQALPLSDSISPICLTPYDTNVLGSQLVVAGWGRLGNGFSTVLPRYLQQTELTIINGQSICQAMSPFWNPNMMLCALDLTSGQSSNACLGDSGGGLVGWSNGGWYLYGIVSYVIVRDRTTNFVESRCINQQPSYYTRVAVYYSWISSNL